MNRLLNIVSFLCRGAATLGFAVSVASVSPAYAQGVTTASMTGLVRDAQGAVIPGAAVTAIHEPSGTRYETITQGDGRFFIPGCGLVVRTASVRRSADSAPK